MPRTEGQIVSRGRERWLVRVYLGRDQETGQRRYASSTVRGSLRAAQSALHQKIGERNQGRELADSGLTLNDYLDRWLELSVRPRLRAKTLKDYCGLLDRSIRPALGEKPITALVPLDFQLVYHALHEKNLSPRTIHYTHSVVHAALAQAVKWQLLTENPAAGVALPKPVRPGFAVMNADQARRFLVHALAADHGILFALALTSGMRPSEYLALRWSDIDWEDETVTVARTLQRGSGWKFLPTKRAASRRRVKLTGWICRQLWHQYIGVSAQLNAADAPSRPIFQTPKGDPINPDSLAREFKRLLEKAGLAPMRLYDLRHTAATLALTAGVPAKVVSEQLGHATSALTLDVYSHVLPHLQAEAAERVAALLGMSEPCDSIIPKRMPPRSINPQDLEQGRARAG